MCIKHNITRCYTFSIFAGSADLEMDGYMHEATWGERACQKVILQVNYSWKRSDQGM